MQRTTASKLAEADGEGAGEGGGGGGGGSGGEWQWRVAVAAAVVEVMVRAGGGAEDNRLLTSHSTWPMYRAAQSTLNQNAAICTAFGLFLEG
jgi:hypothetical protein